ncbi:DUF3558 domain-containing protein [Actinokineospora sp.]|uniref:DUF3558 domain-containing protein n=1 Tax=Actinokineospora sp. TaxID=1872133 RepID=UPI003D6A5EAC
MSRLALATSLIIVAATTVGCSEPSSGTAVPSPSTTSGTTSKQPSSKPSTPPRPREIRLVGKDPCTLIPQSDWTKFHIEKPGKARVRETTKSPDCFFSTDVGSFSVTTVVTEGVATWLDGSRNAEAKETDPVAGFPALKITLGDRDFGCNVAVDVADGQYLWTTVILDDSKVDELPERCEYAHQLAESAMKTLVGS